MPWRLSSFTPHLFLTASAHFNHLLMDFVLARFFSEFDETHKGNSIVLAVWPTKTILLVLRVRHYPPRRTQTQHNQPHCLTLVFQLQFYTHLFMDWLRETSGSFSFNLVKKKKSFAQKRWQTTIKPFNYSRSTICTQLFRDWQKKTHSFQDKHKEMWCNCPQPHWCIWKHI